MSLAWSRLFSTPSCQCWIGSSTAWLRWTISIFQSHQKTFMSMEGHSQFWTERNIEGHVGWVFKYSMLISLLPLFLISQERHIDSLVHFLPTFLFCSFFSFDRRSLDSGSFLLNLFIWQEKQFYLKNMVALMAPLMSTGREVIKW